MKRYIIALAFVVGCGGSQHSGSAAYNTAVRIAKRICQAVDALPDPPASSGGETAP